MTITKFGRVALWVVAALLLFMATYFGLNRLRADPVVLENYAVPPEIAEEVSRALSGALWRGQNDPPIGAVTLMPNGRLVVTAPASVQRSVSRIIDDITENKPGPTPAITFDVWVVTATAGGNPQTPEALAEVGPALEVIRKAKGPQAFELLEKLSTVARTGRDSSDVHGARSSMKVDASLRRAEDNQQLVAAKLRIGINGLGWNSGLEAQTEMRPGELLVVGQSALGSPMGAPPSNKQVYYIVRATL